MASPPYLSLSFTEEEATALVELDSLEFGFFRIDANDNRKLLERAVFYLDGIIAKKVYELEEARAKEEQEELRAFDETQNSVQSPANIRVNVYLKYSKMQDKGIPPVIYLLLGHYQLLLNLYDDAFSAYSKYESLVDENGRRNLSFLYGLALCCFHFGAFNRALLLFQQILYLQPSFPRRKEIHIRLGYIYKLRKDLDKSHRHFRQALHDESPSTWGPIEKVCGRIKQAKATYEQILESVQPDTATHVQHLCLRQLAWLYQTGGGGQIGSKGEPGVVSLAHKELAIQLLQKAVDLDSSNGKTWYLLGRCQAAVNRVQDAFRAYRSSIDKTEASADTWCSIGVLYQEQNQPMDALQAYFCAVQLDKCHVTAWVNLGTLYESMHQFKEALKCYTNAANADKRDVIKPPVKARIATLQQLLPRLADKVMVGCGSVGVDVSLVNAAGGAISSSALSTTPLAKLPTVDAAWDLPIPAELTQRQVQLMLQEANRSQCSAFSNSGSHWAALLSSNAIKLEEEEEEGGKAIKEGKGDSRGGIQKQGDELPRPFKRLKMEEEEEGEEGRKRDFKELSLLPDPPPSVDEISTLYSLLCQGNGQSARQRHQFQRIYAKAFNYLLYKKSHPEVAATLIEDPFACANRRIFKRQVGTNSASEGPEGTAVTTTASSVKVSTSAPPACETSSADDAEKVGQRQQQQVDATVAELLSAAANDDTLGADQLSDDFALLTDDLFAQLNTTADDLVDITLFQNPPSSTNGGGDGECAGTAAGTSTTAGATEQGAPSTAADVKSTEGETQQCSSTQPKRETVTSSSQKDNGAAAPSNASEVPPKSSTPPKLVRNLGAFLTRPVVQLKSPTADLNASMTAKQIIDAVSGLGRLGGPWWNSLLPEGSPLPSPPEKPLPACPADRLLPPTPCVYLDKRKDAVSPELARFCLSQPVVVVRGLAAALRMDLGLFSTKSLVEANPNQRIEIRTQSVNGLDKTRSATLSPTPLGEQSPWFLESPRSQTTIARYANYQAASFKEALREEKQGPVHQITSDSTSTVERDSGTFAKGTSYCGDPMQRAPKVSPGGKSAIGSPVSTPPRKKLIRFGIICDLSDEEKWLPQLHELNKLPTAFRVTSAVNMLSHIGYPLIGIPGSKTPGHQECNNTCAVNINVGPGDCEWFAVPEQYWGVLHQLTERQGLDFLTGTWWPDVEELRQEGVPLYRFLQKPGDLVWLNAGTVYWVQALGWCNNIAWNIGPLTARQYQLAVERFEYNRLRNVKSPVPMIHLSWQLAKNIRVGDVQLYELIRHALLRTMVDSQLILDFLDQVEIQVKRHGKKPDDIAHSCQDCERESINVSPDFQIEVFNLLFVTTQEKKTEVRCFACARRSDPSLRSFSVLSEYYMQELAAIYDNFQFQVVTSAADEVGSIAYSLEVLLRH
ncbi:Histone demethylase UTY [Taenia solium]|eukprot:TsM_000780500 transcript=TsM_000780500 gene=TsM_000780500